MEVLCLRLKIINWKPRFVVHRKNNINYYNSISKLYTGQIMTYMRLYDIIIIGRDKMEQDFLKIKKFLLEYIKLILNNYSNYNRKKY